MTADLTVVFGGDSSAAERAAQRTEASIRRVQVMQQRAQREMTEDFAQRAKEQAAIQEKQARAAEDAARRQSEAFAGVGRGMVVAGGLIAAGIGVAVAKFAEFDQAMSSVQASTHESAQGMADLREAALKAGADTAFSATEAAQAEDELAKAGVATADIVGGALAGALDLASAGQLDVADAAQTTATALSVFGLEGDQASHVADLLAAGAGKAQGSVGDMGAALNQSALVAHQFGLSIEDTTGTLALFAKNGLIGSDAGTSFRTMLLRLTNPTKEAADLMSQLGINVYNSSGQFVGMEGIAGQLQDRMGGLDEATRNAALGTIFGSDAIRAASILYEDGAEGVQTWTDNVNDQGYAAETAALKMDNLAGDLEKLRGALDTALIQTGESANGVLRDLVQSGTSLIDLYSGLPGPVKEGALVLAGLTAAVGLAGGAYFIAKPKIEAFRTAVQTTTIVNGEAITSTSLMGKAVLGLGKALPVVGIALSAGAILLGQYEKRQEENRQRAEEFADSLDDVTGALTDQSSQLVASKLQPFTDQLEDLGLTLGEATRIVISGGPAYEDLVAQLTGLGDVSGTVANRAGQVSSAQKDQAAKARDLRDAVVDQRGAVQDGLEIQKAAAEADAAAGGAAKDHAAALDDLKSQAQGLIQQTPELTDEQQDLADRFGLSADSAVQLSDAMKEVKRQQDILTGATVSALEGQIGYEKALDDADDTLKRITESQGELGAVVDSTTGSFDLSTEAGRLAAEQLIDIRDKSLDYADAVYEQTGNEEDYRNILEQARLKLVEKGIQYGLTEDQAKAYADQILKIPEQRTTTLSIDDQEARAQVAALDASITEAFRRRTLYYDDKYTGHGGPLEGLAEGGYVPPTDGGRVYRLGEGGEGEWVVPESKVGKFIGRQIDMRDFGHYGEGGRSTGFSEGGYSMPADQGSWGAQGGVDQRQFNYYDNYTVNNPYRRETSRERSRSAVLVGMFGDDVRVPGGGRPI